MKTLIQEQIGIIFRMNDNKYVSASWEFTDSTQFETTDDINKAALVIATTKSTIKAWNNWCKENNLIAQKILIKTETTRELL